MVFAVTIIKIVRHFRSKIVNRNSVGRIPKFRSARNVLMAKDVDELLMLSTKDETIEHLSEIQEYLVAR